MEILERLLYDLYSLSQDNSDETLDAFLIATNIFSNVSSEEEVVIKRYQQYNLLFNSDNPPSLLKFLTSVVKIKEKSIIKAKTYILKMIGEVVKYNDSNVIDEFTNQIFQVSFDIFKRDDSSEVKSAATIPIKNIVRKTTACDVLSISLSEIYDTLLDELSHNKKLSKGIKCEIFKVLGLLVKAFSNEEATASKRSLIINQVMLNLKRNFEKDSQPELSVIAGCFSCMDRCMQIDDLSNESITFLWACCLKSITAASSEDIHRYMMTSKALRFLKNHVGDFKSLISLNIQQIHSSLLACCKANYKGLEKHLLETLHSVLIQFSRFILEENHGPSILFLHNLISNYISILSNDTHSVSERSFAVNSVSALSPALFYIKSPVERPKFVYGIITSLINYCNKIDSAFNSELNTAQIVYQKSQYLTTVCCLANSLVEEGIYIQENVLDQLLEFLNFNVVYIVDNYFNCFKKQKIIAKRSLCCYFNVIYKISTGKLLSANSVINFLSNKCISRTSSYEFVEDCTDGRLYRIYFDFCKEILNPDDKYTLSLIYFYQSSQTYRDISILIYDQLLHEFLFKLNNFDLNYSREAETSAYVAVNIADQELYINLGWFLYLFLSEMLTQRFVINWSILYFDKLKEMSSTFPMISTSYKLAKLCLKVTASEKFFHPNILKIISDLVANINSQLDNFDGELLITALDFLLTIPPSFAEFDHILPAVKLSLSNQIKCKEAFQCIELYILSDSSKFYELVPEILTHVSLYLVPRSNESKEFISAQYKSKTRKFKQKAYQGAFDEGSSTTDDVDTCVEFMAIRLLGRLGGKNQLILNPKNSVTSSKIWNYESDVDIYLSSDDLKLKLGNIIPILLELSSSKTSHNQKKLLACESLHSLILYMIGTSASDPQRLTRSLFADCYESILPCVINLANSNDSIVKELFHSFLLQIVHWFSGKNQVHASETTLLIESLLEGLCSECEPGLRDISATALSEYMIWAIKQSTIQELEKDSGYIETLINKLLNLCISPDERKRLGSSNVLSKIHKLIREEVSLISRYVLNITFSLFQSHRLGGKCQDEIGFSIQNYLSIIYKSVMKTNDAAKLLSEQSYRKTNPRTLKDFINFLSHNLAHTNLSFRRRCMYGFILLAPLLADASTIEHDNHLESKISRIGYKLLFENKTDFEKMLVKLDPLQVLGNDELSSEDASLESINNSNSESESTSYQPGNQIVSCVFHNILDDGSQEILSKAFDPLHSKTNVKSFLIKLNASLDMYTWLFQNQIVKLSQLCDPSNYEENVEQPKAKKQKIRNQINRKTCPSIFPIITYFLKNYWNFLQNPLFPDVNTQTEAEDLNLIRIETLRRILQMLSTAFSIEKDLVLFNFLKDFEIFNLIFRLIIPIALQESGSQVYSHNASQSQCKNDELDKYLPLAFLRLIQSLKLFSLDLDSHEYVANLISDTSRIFRSINHADNIFIGRFDRFICIFIENKIERLIFGTDYTNQMEIYSLNILRYLLCIPNFSTAQVSLLGEALLKLALGLTSRVSYLLGTLKKENSSLISFSEKYAKVLTEYVYRNEIDLLTKSERKTDDLNSQGEIYTFLSIYAEKSSSEVLNLLIATLLTTLENDVEVDYSFKSYVLNSITLSSLKCYTKLQLLRSCMSIPAALRKDNIINTLTREALANLSNHSSSIEILKDSLNTVPYILPGASSNSPLQFQNRSATDECTEALEEFVASSFPLNSHQSNTASFSSQDYFSLLESYLKCFSYYCIADMLSPLLPTLKEGKKHKHIEHIQNSFKDFAANFHMDENNTNIVDVLDKLLKILFHPLLDFEIKKFLFEDLIVVLLRNCSSNTLEILLSSENIQMFNIKKLVEVINDTNTNLNFNKAVAYSILAISYDKCSITSIKENITLCYFGPSHTGKELTQVISKSAHSLLRSASKPNNMYTEIDYFLFKAAFNCLAFLVSKTQSNEEFYSTFLFKQTNKTLFWDKIINLSQDHVFRSRSSSVKSHLIGSMSTFMKTTIKNHSSASFQTNPYSYLFGTFTNTQLPRTNYSQNVNDEDDENVDPAPKNFLSQQQQQHASDSLFMASSLSKPRPYVHSSSSLSTQNFLEDITDPLPNELDEIEPENMNIQSQQDNMDGINSNSHESTVVGFDDVIIEIELKDLNEEACMEGFIRAIQRMHSLSKDKWNSGAVPSWLDECIHRLNEDPDYDPKTRNIRLFVLRLFTNEPVADIVSIWSQNLIIPVLKCCLNDLCLENLGISYFLKDVIYLFIKSWKVQIDENISDLISRLFSFLFRSLFTSDVKDLQDNMKYTTTLLKIWCSHPSVNKIEFQPIFTLASAEEACTGGAHGSVLSKGTESMRKRLTGLQILITAFENNYSFLDTNELFLKFSSILTSVLTSIKYNRKEVSDLASYLAGIVLKFLSDKSEIETLNKFSYELNETILSKLALKDGVELIVSNMKKICLTFPKFLTRQTLLKIFSGFSKIKSKSKAEFLDILLYSQELEDFSFITLLKPFIPSLLADLTTIAKGRGKSITRLPAIQLNTLDLLIKYSNQLDYSLLNNLIGENDGLNLLLNENTSNVLRNKCYKLLMNVYLSNENLKQDRVGNEKELRKKIIIMLLRGLTLSETHNDNDNLEPKEKYTEKEIKNEILSFFHSNFGLDENPCVRLFQLMTYLFDTNYIDNWLSYCTFLCLSGFENLTDFSRVIFSTGLADETRFNSVDYSQARDSSSYNTYDPSIPLFALERTQSQSQSQSQSYQSFNSVSRQGKGENLIRQTQVPLWTQTQGRGTQIIKQLPYEMSTQYLLGTTHRDSTINPAHKDDQLSIPIIRQKKNVSFFVNTTNVEANSTSENSLDPSKTRGSVAQKVVGGHKDKKAAVSMCRKYREGELPDILITLMDILNPVKQLCLMDRKFSSVIFESIFEMLFFHEPSVSKIFKNKSNSKESKMQLVNEIDMRATNLDSNQSLCKALENIISNSNTSVSIGNTEFFSSIFNVILNCLDKYRCIDNKELLSPILHFSYDSIANLSLISQNVYGGIRLLEEILILKKQDKGSCSRDHLNNIWLQLSKLYGKLNEKDILLGIAVKISSSEQSKQALDYEIEGKYSEAIEIYNTLIEEALENSMEVTTVDNSIDFNIEYWNERSLDCVHQLLDWTQLHNNINILIQQESQTKSLEQNFDNLIVENKKFREKYLHKYLCCLTHSRELNNKIEAFLNKLTSPSVTSEPSVKLWIETACSIEVALSYAHLGLWNTVQVYIEASYDHFLQSWISTNPSAHYAKRAILQNLQRLVELEDGVKLNNFRLTDKDCIKLWKRSRPDTYDPLYLWDDILCGRSIVSSYFEPEDSKKSLLDIGKFHTEIALTAIKQGVLQVVPSQLGSSSNIQKKILGKITLHPEDIVAIYNYNIKKISNETLTKPKDEIILMYKKTLTLLDNQLSDQPHNLHSLMMKADLMQHWAEYSKIDHSESVSHTLQSFETLKSATAIVSVTDNLAGEIYSKFAIFCNDILDKREGITLATDFDSDTEDDEAPRENKSNEFLKTYESNELAKLSVDAYIKGLLAGCVKSRDSMLRILNLIGRYYSTAEMFINALQHIPSWYFLKFTSHLIGSLEKNEKVVVEKILNLIITKYPKFIYYPYKIAMQSLNVKAKKNIEDISTKIIDSSYERFISNLDSLTHPHLWIKDRLMVIKREIISSNLSAASNYFKLLIEGLHTFVTGNSDLGSYNLEYFINFKKILHSKKIDKSTVINLDIINLLIEQLQAIKVLHQSGGVKISHFSLWLSSFDPTTHKIELPGANLKEDIDPHSQDVDYIFSIDQNLLVMDSIRKPKRIVIYGISGQEYKYLVKSGEDLRCDQRIQQLFNSMNNILISATNNLQIRTYKVIPMTTSLGILEWIANTIPMNKMICESMLNDETFKLQNPKAFKENKQSQSKEFNIKLLAASEERLNWINYKGDAKIYHDNFINKSHKDAVSKWESVTSKMPDDFLRKKIIKSAHSPEAFYSFRTEFSKSLSISSIYCFICGIGDRHLDNILIDVKSGSVIHIDFDMCFGKATFILPVPEFIPFRLTPQMLAVVQPLNGGILFRRYMISTLTALRSISSIKYLSNELEIYLTDPVTDWLKSEKERGRIQELIEDEKWEPKRRIMSTVRKLNGANPVALVLEDLAQNIHVKKYKSYQSLALILQNCCKNISPDVTIKSDEKKILDPREIIDILMQLATESDILVRQWEGLTTWI